MVRRQISRGPFIYREKYTRNRIYETELKWIIYTFREKKIKLNNESDNVPRYSEESFLNYLALGK